MRYYHIWFQTKMKKYLLLGEIDSKVHDLFRLIAKEKDFQLLAYETMLDHAHLLLVLKDF